MAPAGAPNLDVSLDELIAANNTKAGRRGRGRGGGRQGNSGGNADNRTIILGGGGLPRPGGRGARRAQGTPYAVPAGLAAASSEGSKIMVSNLHYNVTEADIKELFSTQVGPLRKVMLSFDQTGRSRGVSEVVFRNEKDAAIAYQRFNGVTLDGRPMKIEIILQSDHIRRNLVVGPMNSARGSRSGRFSSGRGRGRSGLGARGRTGRPPTTAEELDAEMAAYMSGTAEKSVAMEEDISM